MLLNIFVETMKTFDVESSKEQNLFEMEIFTNIINAFYGHFLSI